MIPIDGRIAAYVADAPAAVARKGCGILYLPDIRGIWKNSKLMADGFAANGFTTLVLDILDGDSVSGDKSTASAVIDWLKHGSPGRHPHTPEYVDPLVIAAIRAMRDMGVEKIASVGYCFGAKYVVRHYKSGIDVGFVAHPSLVDEEELEAITGPLSIAAAEIDSIFPAELRHKSEAILADTGQRYMISLYSGVEHGFAVRCNQDIREERFARDQVFRQALVWFDDCFAG